MTDKRHTSPKEEDREKGWRWTGLVTTALTATVSIIAAVISAYSASQANKQADLLARYKIEREGQFARHKIEREGQLKVYERVESQLANPQPHNLVIASAYVQLIEDPPIRKALCETIGSIAFAQLASSSGEQDRGRLEAALRDVVRVARDCYEAMEVGRASQGAQDGNGAGALATAPASAVQDRATEEAPVTRLVTNASASASGWDIDVFWCQSQGPPSRELATRVAEMLAGMSTRGDRPGGEQLGRIRLRSVSPAVQSSLIAGGGNRIFGSADEAAFSRAVAGELNRRLGSVTISYSPTSGSTRWYVSLFTCGFPGRG